jgi:TonB family protein
MITLYRSNVLKTTYQHIIYPSLAIDKELAGDIVIAITLNREGEVTDIDQLESGAHHSLNNAAIKAIQQSQYPAPPKSLRERTSWLSYRSSFACQNKKTTAKRWFHQIYNTSLRYKIQPSANQFAMSSA